VTTSGPLGGGHAETDNRREGEPLGPHISWIYVDSTFSSRTVRSVAIEPAGNVILSIAV